MIKAVECILFVEMKTVVSMKNGIHNIVGDVIGEFPGRSVFVCFGRQIVNVGSDTG